MKEIRLAYKIFKTLIKDNFQYPDRVIVDSIAMLARCGLLLVLYAYVFKLKGGTVNGVTFPLVAWSMFFYFALMTLSMRKLTQAIMADVKSGNIEVLLSKPISYLSYRIWWQIGEGFYSFALITLVGGAVMGYIIGFPPTMQSPLFAMTLIATLVLGTVLMSFLYGIIGLCAFWIEDASPILWLVDKAVMVLGGSFLPIALFPTLMYQIAIWSPFGSSQLVTHTVYVSWQSSWYQLMSIQVFWIFILGVIAVLMFNRAQKQVSVNGG